MASSILAFNTTDMTQTRGRRHSAKILRTFAANKLAVVGLFLLIGMALVALLAPWLAPYNPVGMQLRARLEPPQASHLFGTDNFGRDVLSRVIYAARTSLVVGLGAVLVGAVLGVTLGAIAGVARGIVETTIMRTMDVLMTFPTLIMGIVVMAVLGSGLLKLILALGVIMMPRFARIAYAPTLTIREKEYMYAAKAIGVPGYRILLRHVLPNLVGEILIAGALWVGSAIKIEAGLSFVGLGVSPPTPTWGNMIDDGLQYLSNAPWICLFAGLAILVTILSLNMLGDGLRDALDPRLRR